MSKISDKQWDSGFELSSTNLSEAIIRYKEALKTSGHPFLYTNIASAYHRLGDFENSAIWYKKSEPMLLTLEDKYSANPYANYANFLYGQKSYKKALKFSLIAMDIDSETIIFIENHVRILLALEEKEDALPYLLKLRLTVPDWESIQDLLEENKKEIDASYDNYWSVKNKSAAFGEIIRLHDIEVDKLQKYMDSAKGVIPNIQYDKWDSIFKDMLSNGIEITDSYFIKLFKILIKREEYLNLFNFFNSIIENTIPGYKLILNLVKQAGMKKEVAVQQLLKNVTKDNEEFLIEALSKDLIPSYKKDLKVWIKELNNPIARVTLIQVMQNTDPSYFKSEIINYLEKNIDSKRFNLILSKLNDQKLKESLFTKKLENWFNSIEEFKGKDEFFKLIKNFITLKKNNINKILEEYNKEIKYDNYFNYWENFIDKFQSKNNEDLYNKSFKLSLIFDPHTTIENHISYNGNINNILNKLEEYEIPKTFYLKHLIKEIYKNEDKGTLINEFILEHFNDVIDSFELTSIKERVAIFPIIWEIQKEKFTPILLELTNSNSKTIQTSIKELLKQDDTIIDSIISLLKERKVSTRAIAVEILLSKNIEKLNNIVKAHNEVEKSDTIKKMIHNVLEQN